MAAHRSGSSSQDAKSEAASASTPHAVPRLVSESSWNASPSISRSRSSAAMLVIGSGIRSTQWLWLEDDDRAMAVLRCVLEQVARSRTWRLKPEKARLLEERSETTPRDWLENAGWRRLSPLNRALGEFAHVRPSRRWNAARALLASLQLDVDEDTAIFTARGAAL